MKNLLEFAQGILERNSIETMIEIICSLTDDEIKMIAKG